MAETLDHAGLPLGAGEERIGNAPAPRLSVILPLDDHRGFALAAVKSWSAAQDVPRERFEIVVLTNGADPALHEKVSALLAPHDQMIVAPGANLMALYKLGAERARGEVLLITEGHCEAEPGVVRATWAHFAAGGEAAVGLGCFSRSVTPLERMEDRLFQRDLAWRAAHAPWNKLLLRGSAIRRDVYFAVGGLRPELGFFAEPALAGALHDAGVTMGVVPSARICHRNTSKLSEIYASVRDYAPGQCIARAGMGAAAYENHFGRLPEWRHFGAAAARNARAAWADCLRLCLRPGTGAGRRRAAAALARLAPPAAFGTQGPILAAAARTLPALFRTWVWRQRDARLERAYLDTHTCFASLIRLRWLRRNTTRAMIAPIGLGRTGAEDCTEERVLGLHLRESFAGAPFRWTEPVALFPLRLAPGRHRIVLETRGLRPGLGPGDLALAFDSRPLADDAVSFGSDAVTIEVGVETRKRGDSRLLLLCRRLAAPGSPDRRALGLPLFSITIHSSAPETGASAAP
ncbi:MAG: hypothetical protein KIT16_11860 [Rhodospirillaceae bacterium]|nr:hypothetical protein [Rhodospirillaceae bacterium]